MGMTTAEKILARAAGKEEVKPNEYVTAKIDFMLAGGKSGVFEHMSELGIEQVWDPERIMINSDHRSPATDITQATHDKYLRDAGKKYGIKYVFDHGRGGINHLLMVEKGLALPGELVTGQDSHTVTYGGINVAATCVDLPEAVLVAVKGETWFRVPETIKYRIDGQLQDNVMSKDIMLKIGGTYGLDYALYKSVEFVGSTVDAMSIDSRLAMANWSIDIGGVKFALFEADQKTLDYVRPRAKRPFTPVKADSDAVYAEEKTMDATSLTPQVACPHIMWNVKPVSEVEKEKIKINQGFVGTCSNGRIEDLEATGRIVKGNKIHPDVRLIIIPGSQEVYQEAAKTGLLDVFVESEAVVCAPNCGPCGGGPYGVLAPGERCISTSNRNYKGRMGSPDSEIYLASPTTVAASSLAGYIVDPRKT